MVSKERLEFLIDQCSKNNKYSIAFKPGMKAEKTKDPFAPQWLLKEYICPYLTPKMELEGVECEYAERIADTKYYRCNAKKL